MGVTVKAHLLRVGACRHLECMAISGGRWSPVEFPALCALIEHPSRGWILFDTGYADHFLTATDPWPERLYRALLPVDLPPAERLALQLARHGLTPDDIGTLIISHYHGDHIAGLRDFPRARLVAFEADTRHFLSLAGKRWRATLSGHLPALLPEDFQTRFQAADAVPRVDLPAWLHPFASGFDLFGDGSLIAVPLPGHSHAQLGLFLPNVDGAGRPVFLIADACWSLPALRAGRPPASVTRFLNADSGGYQRTFSGLHGLAVRESAIALLPSHCAVAWEEFLRVA